MSLSISAKRAFLWGGGSTLIQDVAQFGTMLIMVRILDLETYGQAALAQSIYLFVGIVSAGSFLQHSLQLRDPRQIDWQVHFSSAAFINGTLFLLTIAIAWALHSTEKFAGAALPLSVLAVAFLIEIPGILRLKMLESTHDWARFRVLLLTGAFLGLGVGLVLAIAGAGVYALVIQFPLNLLPAAIDLFVWKRWRPDLTWSWERYSDTFRFGLNRVGAMAAGRSRQAVEHATIAAVWSFSALGVYTRASGLATISAGRLGPLTAQIMYPVLTRADQGSERYQRMAALLLQGAWWATIPMVTFLICWPETIIEVLYGSKWNAVAEILPLASAAIGLVGLGATSTSLLLANNQTRAALLIEVASALIGIVIVLSILTSSIQGYLVWLIVLGFVTNAIVFIALGKGKALRARALLAILFPPVFGAILGALAATYVVLGLTSIGDFSSVLMLMGVASSFGLAYLVTLRLVAPQALLNLVEVVPGTSVLIKLMKYPPAT